MSAARQPVSAMASEIKCRFILFVAGDEPNSRAARGNLAELCNEDLHGRCEVAIVDVLQDFAAASGEQHPGDAYATHGEA